MLQQFHSGEYLHRAERPQPSSLVSQVATEVRQTIPGVLELNLQLWLLEQTFVQRTMDVAHVEHSVHRPVVILIRRLFLGFYKPI